MQNNNNAHDQIVTIETNALWVLALAMLFAALLIVLFAIIVG